MITRRRILSTGAAATALMAMGPLKTSQIAGASEGGTPVSQSAPAKVVAADGERLTLEKIEAEDSALPTEPLRFAGFPRGVIPRPGDVVLVNDYMVKGTFTAGPLCHWVRGKVTRDTQGRYVIGRHVAEPLGERDQDFPVLLEASLESGHSLAVCFLETRLPTGLILDARPDGIQGQVLL